MISGLSNVLINRFITLGSSFKVQTFHSELILTNALEPKSFLNFTSVQTRSQLLFTMNLGMSTTCLGNGVFEISTTKWNQLSGTRTGWNKDWLYMEGSPEVHHSWQITEW